MSDEHVYRIGRHIIIDAAYDPDAGGHPYVPKPCTNWKGCVLAKGHKDECLDKDGWPARWSDPTYLGDGPWGA